MKAMNRFAILFFFFLSLSCSRKAQNYNLVEIKNDVDNYLIKTMETNNIPGLALAVIQDNDVIYENCFGFASLEENSPVNKNTLFRIFSTTKLITSTAIFQLIQQNKLSLDDKISINLNSLPDEWQNIKIKHLLSHSSGLPDFIRYESKLSDKELFQKLIDDTMEFETGDQFQYNQTNYWLLAKIIEKVSGTTFDQFILKNQFDDTHNGVLFSSNSQESILHRATRYYYDDSAKVFQKDTLNVGKRGHSGNGLNITLSKFIDWNKQLDNNTLLSQKVKSKMWSQFEFGNKKDIFLHGWGSYNNNNLRSYGFSGGNLAAFRKYTNEKTTIILLSNGYEIPAYDIIVNDVARMVIPKLRDADLTFEQEIMNLTLDNQFEKALEAFNKLKKENPNHEFDNLKWNINSYGNSFAYQNEAEKAREVYKFNTRANPNWWVSIAGIAETYEMQENFKEAIEYYKKAILLNTDNQWGYNEFMDKKIKELKKAI